jgi:hypothetical protein
MASVARGKKRGRTGKVLPTEYTVHEYLWAATHCGSLRELNRFLEMGYSAMCDHLQRIELMTEVRNLLDEKPGKPGPKTVPQLVSIYGTSGAKSGNVEDIIEEMARRYDRKDERAREKSNQHIYFDGGPIALCFVGDQHIGNAGTDIRRVIDEQNTILETPGAFCWQMGDSVDNFIVGRLMAENMKPAAPVWEQWEVAQWYLERWRERLLAYNGGNHDAWTLKVSGIDYRRDITPDGVLYDGDRIDATVHVGDAQFRVTSRHKWAGNSKYNPTHGMEGGKGGAMHSDPNFDIYVGAHFHKGAVAREFIHNGERKISVLTGTYKIHDDYALQEGFEKHDASTASAVILHEDGSFFGTSNLKACLYYMKALYGEDA